MLNILLSASLFLMIAYSFSLIYSTTKIFHLAHGGVITLGAYFVFLFAKELFINFSVSVVLSLVLSSLIGVLFEVLVFRKMRKRNVSALVYLIASIGLYIVLQNLISLFFGDNIKIINTSEVTAGNRILGAYITTVQIITILVSIILFIMVTLFLHFTVTGKSIRAVASNPELCSIFGISSNKIILIAFGFASALAATAGILSAMDTDMTPTMGFNLLLYGIVAMIIGGVDSTWGLVGGSLLLAAAQNLGAYYISSQWMNAIAYIILILFLIWKPLGFSGKRLKKVEL